MSEDHQTKRPDEPATCGQGLAAHSAVPAKIAELLEALADNLTAHLPTIDTSDASGRAEKDAYEHLATEYSAMASRLGSTAERMRGYRDLPAARHHQEALADPELVDVFERFVALEKGLARLLRDSAERDDQLLQEARRAEA